MHTRTQRTYPEQLRTGGAHTVPAPRAERGAPAGLPSALVHKRRPVAALVEGAEARMDPGRYTVDLRWPGAGMFRADPQHEPLLVLEALRQTVIGLSHRFHGVPAEHPFILSGIGFEFTSPTGRVGGRSDAGTARLEASCEILQAGPRRFAAVMQAEVFRHGRSHARGTVRWEAVDPALYRALRGRSPGADAAFPAPGRPAEAPPLPAAEVGSDPADVLLSRSDPAEPGRWRLSADTGNLWYFDHAVDHLPGMLLVEALRQAGYAALRPSPAAAEPRLAGATFTFHSFGSLVSATTVRAQPPAASPRPGHTALRMSAVQGERVLCDAATTWRQCPGPVHPAL